MGAARLCEIDADCKGGNEGMKLFIFLLKLLAIRTDNQSMEANLFLILATADAVGCAMYAGTLWAIPWGVLCVVCAAMGLRRAFGE